MKPVDQPGAQLLTAPGCFPLPAVQVQYADGVYGVVSAWELDEQELADIARTGRLWLEIRGTTQPPVLITTRCPYKDDPLG
jgi:hypothetical protein